MAAVLEAARSADVHAQIQLQQAAMLRNMELMQNAPVVTAPVTGRRAAPLGRALSIRDMELAEPAVLRQAEAEEEGGIVVDDGALPPTSPDALSPTTGRPRPGHRPKPTVAIPAPGTHAPVKRKAWRPPSVNIAKAFQDEHAPRWIDKRGRKRPFPVCSTKTGRHCSERCACCDPFAEGTESWLSEYGPGVSNYFKTVKAIGWIMFIATVISLPLLILNIFGSTSIPSYTSKALGATTIGIVSRRCDSS
jgi:hypothetical protein